MVFSSKAVVAMSSPLNPSFVQHAQQGVRQARLSRKAGKLCKPSNQLFATSKQTKNTVIPYIKLGSLQQVRLICASARILDPTTQSWAGVAALQELHIGGSRHLRSAQASQIHIIPPNSNSDILYANRPLPYHAMHKLGHYARIPAAMCPRTPRMWRTTGMNAEHNETVGQQVQT